MGDVREKKIKQSIVVIAIILGLCGYYSVQRLVTHSEKTELKDNITPCSINNNVQQDKVSPESFE